MWVQKYHFSKIKLNFNVHIDFGSREKKVVVNFIYGYQNLSGEKYKPNGKRINSIRHTSEEKNPKNHPKIPLSYFGPIISAQRVGFFNIGSGRVLDKIPGSGSGRVG